MMGGSGSLTNGSGRSKNSHCSTVPNETVYDEGDGAGAVIRIINVQS